uniref:tail fiber assembly protein n=1 Tax=Serratia quinivorans TaxID=137545 RepID=UPI0035C6B30D
MKIESAANPRTKEENTYIDLDITCEDGCTYPFTAMPTDPEGAELFKKAKSGEFGEVSNAPDDSYQWNGMKWVSPTRESLIAAAEVDKSTRSAIAESAISPLERAVRLNIATEEENDSLAKWEIYSVLLNRIDTSSAPNIEWPVMPQ